MEKCNPIRSDSWFGQELKIKIDEIICKSHLTHDNKTISRYRAESFVEFGHNSVEFFK